MITFIVTAMLLGSAYISYRLYAYWGTTQGSFWARARATSAHSATILWNMIVVVVSTAGSCAVYFGDALSDGTIQMWLKEHVDLEVFGLIMVASALVSIMTRARSL